MRKYVNRHVVRDMNFVIRGKCSGGDSASFGHFLFWLFSSFTPLVGYSWPLGFVRFFLLHVVFYHANFHQKLDLVDQFSGRCSFFPLFLLS